MWGILLGAIGAVALLFYVYNLGGENAVASYKEKLDAAQKQIDDNAKAQVEAAANHIIDMQAAYDVGEDKGKADATKVAARVKTMIAKSPALQNPECTLDEDSFATLRAALQGTRKGVDLPPDAPRPAPGPPLSSRPSPPPKPTPRTKGAP